MPAIGIHLVDLACALSFLRVERLYSVQLNSLTTEVTGRGEGPEPTAIFPFAGNSEREPIDPTISLPADFPGRGGEGFVSHLAYRAAWPAPD